MSEIDLTVFNIVIRSYFKIDSFSTKLNSLTSLYLIWPQWAKLL